MCAYRSVIRKYWDVISFLGEIIVLRLVGECFYEMLAEVIRMKYHDI